eukprot:1159474-Pelagomonas_calceolata.AAC.1
MLRANKKAQRSTEQPLKPMLRSRPQRPAQGHVQKDQKDQTLVTLSSRSRARCPCKPGQGLLSIGQHFLSLIESVPVLRSGRHDKAQVHTAEGQQVHKKDAACCVQRVGNDEGGGGAVDPNALKGGRGGP